MKRYYQIAVVLVIIMALVFASCVTAEKFKLHPFFDGFTPSARSAGSFSGNLFANGAFNAAVGRVFLLSHNDDRLTNRVDTSNRMLTSAGDGWFVTAIFENYIDVSSATSIEFSLDDGGQWWHGGILYFYNEDDPNDPFEAQWWEGGGLNRDGTLVFRFSHFTRLEERKGRADFTKLIGFSVKSTDTIAINNIKFN